MSKFPSSLVWRLAAVAMTLVLVACGSAESRRAKYLAHGQEYLRAGNLDKARVELRNAAQIAPKDGEVRYWLGQVAEKAGDLRGAVGQYRSAIDNDPKLLAPRAALGRLYLYVGQSAEALKVVEPGLLLAPNDAQLITVRGAAKQQTGDAAGALEDAKTAVRLAPADSYAIALLASVYRAQGHLPDAIATVRAGVAQLPNDVDLHVILADLLKDTQPSEAEAELKRVIALQPKELGQRERLVRFYVNQKKPAEAEAEQRDIVAALPQSIPAKLELVGVVTSLHGADAGAAEVQKQLTANAHDDDVKLALAAPLYSLGHGADAEGVYRSVIADAGTKPNGLLARSRLATLLIARGARPEAAELVKQVLDESPRDTEALVLRSDLASASGNIDGAITDMRTVLRDQPNSVSAMRQLAKLYQMNREPELAESQLRAALNVAPKDAEARALLAKLLLSEGKAPESEALLLPLAKELPANEDVQATLFRVQAQQKELDAARATAMGLEKSHANRGLGFYLMGLLEESEEHSEDAARDYEQALQVQPTAEEPLAALAHLQLVRHQPERALRAVDKVLAVIPKDAQAITVKAGVLQNSGQTAAAEATYRDAIRAVPTWPNAYQELARLQINGRRDNDAIETLRQGIAATKAPGLEVDLANVYARAGRLADATAVYDHALARDPKALYATNNLALLLVEHSTNPADLAKARKLADQLASQAGPEFIDTRGYVTLKAGDAQAAETLLQDAVNKAPAAPEFRYHLGLAQLQRGEVSSARQNLEQALASGRAFPGMEAAKDSLARIQAGRASG